MLEKLIVIKSETGLHARPAALIVKEAQKYRSKIALVKNDNEYSCKSIMNLLSSGARKDEEVLLRVSGEDEEAAFEALAKLLEGNLEA
ncbi:HPr family phosphocarrier protein [Alkaliphilus serpentinus]|uniref:Phosphocarrier protein HPr n=1 Tax=Alkaliphilus serpentinus TaxID=1482731 RepID=A0A833HR77_9FIRM|nr:HPr family phosphocarrier protein [Alkaliphilus serpentinus]KAB3531581.1 HPr family phosphocarrier protein [Alkaliphilus serpentinus]